MYSFCIRNKKNGLLWRKAKKSLSLFVKISFLRVPILPAIFLITEKLNITYEKSNETNAT